MTTLEELAARAESSAGADRELDAAIFDATNERAHERNGRDLLPWAHCYTSSLDAAMTLVPEGWRLVRLGETPVDDAGPWEALIAQREAAFGRARTSAVQAKTAPLAIVAASLRARAKGVGE